MKLYNNLAELYDLLYSYRDHNKETSFLVEELQNINNPSILDVCSGTGNHLKSLRSVYPKARLAGVDLNNGMLDVARSKGLGARLEKADMKSFDLSEKFDLVYCFSSSIQYNLSDEDFVRTIDTMKKHSSGKIVFDLAFCKERWKEGYTNITAGSNEDYQIAELFTSHSRDGISNWNPLYLVKDNRTGKIDMHVDAQKIKVWGISEVEGLLSKSGTPYRLERGFDKKGSRQDIPIFVLEGFKTD